jgi:3-deoxy-D-manno-octulosonic-acid transferase
MLAVYLLYSLALGLALVLAAPWWLVQMARHGKYRAGLRERLGTVAARLARPATGARTVWLHAVSVGEVLAVSRLVDELRKSYDAVYVSTTTLTGQKLARERFGAESVFYFPLDFAFAVRAYLRALRPQLVVLAETEFWPNFLRLAKQSGAKVAVVNARISDRSLPGYRRNRWFLRPVLRNVDLFLAQTATDADRLREIGAPGERVQAGGNLKYDVEPPRHLPVVDDLRAAIARGQAWPVVVAGSTAEGEEEQLLDAFHAAMGDRGLLILAPRRPERFDAVAKLVSDRYFTHWRRSTADLRNTALTRGVFVLDSVGELAAVYALADLAFVGGSLYPPGGGHNILEPAQHGVPVVVGGFTQNFRDMVEMFRRENALRHVPAGPDGAGPAPALLALFKDLAGAPAEWKAMGERGRALAESHRGATARAAAALRQLAAVPAPAEVRA